MERHCQPPERSELCAVNKSNEPQILSIRRHLVWVLANVYEEIPSDAGNKKDARSKEDYHSPLDSLYRPHGLHFGIREDHAMD